MARFERMSGLAKGIVIDTNDPAGYNRIKVRIPELHGVMNCDEVYHDIRSEIQHNQKSIKLFGLYS